MEWKQIFEKLDLQKQYDKSGYAKKNVGTTKLGIAYFPAYYIETYI